MTPPAHAPVAPAMTASSLQEGTSSPTAAPVHLHAGPPSPVFAYHQRPSLIDFPGHMAGMCFTSGCNFACGFCHNAPLLGRRRSGLAWDRLAAACTHFRHNWVTGMVISGGEPTLTEELPELVEFFRRRGLQVKLDTNGSRPEMLACVLPRLAYVAMDIKCALARYPEFVRWPDTAAIARSVALLLHGPVAYEFRTTVIEGVHTVEEFDEIGGWIQGARRYVLQPFLPRDDLPSPALRALPRTSPQFLERVAARLRSGFGLSVEVRGADQAAASGGRTSAPAAL